MIRSDLRATAPAAVPAINGLLTGDAVASDEEREQAKRRNRDSPPTGLRTRRCENPVCASEFVAEAERDALRVERRVGADPRDAVADVDHQPRRDRCLDAA